MKPSKSSRDWFFRIKDILHAIDKIEQYTLGLDILVNPIDRIKGQDWLGFCNIPSPIMPLIAREQQFAEKIHAYTLPRDGRLNSRVKDLVDLILLLDSGGFDIEKCKIALKAIFKARETHSLPSTLMAPPHEWEELFQKLARECVLDPDLKRAFEIVNSFYENMQVNP